MAFRKPQRYSVGCSAKLCEAGRRVWNILAVIAGSSIQRLQETLLSIDRHQAFHVTVVPQFPPSHMESKKGKKSFLLFSIGGGGLKASEQDEDAREVNKTKKVLELILPANNTTPVILYPSKESFYFPSSFISSK